MASHFNPAYSVQCNNDDDGRPSYYERNRDQVRENQRLYRESNRDKIRAIHKAYYLKNRAKITAYKRERWHQKKAGANGKQQSRCSSDLPTTCSSISPQFATSGLPKLPPARMPLHMLLNPVTSDE
ncbi:hypothetical protein DYB32_007398 [Aphanomyces invadans]|nr:hypothetical protein DYB32_007398 [Aphanomyces invadans]